MNEATKPVLREMGRAPATGSRNEKAHLGVESPPQYSDDDATEQLSRTDWSTPLKRPEERSALERVSRCAASVLILGALLASGILLLNDATPKLIDFVKFAAAIASRAWVLVGHAPLSAMPLLLAGCSYVALQGLLRPAPILLVKRLLLGAAFLLWGIVQLMPPSVVATDLGDLVIALYVFDLGVIIQAELRGA